MQSSACANLPNGFTSSGKSDPTLREALSVILLPLSSRADQLNRSYREEHDRSAGWAARRIRRPQRIKGFESPVAWRAQIIVVPDLEAGTCL